MSNIPGGTDSGLLMIFRGLSVELSGRDVLTCRREKDLEKSREGRFLAQSILNSSHFEIWSVQTGTRGGKDLEKSREGSFFPQSILNSSNLGIFPEHPGNRRGARSLGCTSVFLKCQQRFGSLLLWELFATMRRGGGSTPLRMGEGTETEERVKRVGTSR